MAKQVIILETNPADGGQNTIRAVFWFAVPVARRVPLPATTMSAWSGADANTELIPIRDGSVLEEVKQLSFPQSFTTAQIKGALQASYTDRQTYLATLPPRLQYNGVFWDGATWSA